ncbi:MAG: glucosamine-6-phosphate deaminase [Oscillospiraceae bacterium]|jgi:glucosamine-6-phosphate deaminase|nr:glucosamine-6-phosphate deaminase [Oscillospiraceae bacterium]
MRVIVTNTYAEACEIAGGMITKVVQDDPKATLGLATGSSAQAVYPYIIRAYEKGEVDFSQAHSVNLDEYIGLTPEHDQSYRYFMNTNFFDHVNIKKENTFVASGIGSEEEIVKEFRSVLANSNVAVQLLGIGVDGHVGFNEPGKKLHSEAHIEVLDPSTIKANARFFANEDEVPKKAITMGMGDIMRANKLILVATGAPKADAIRELIMNDEIFVNNPSTMIKMHKDCVVIIDKELAELVGYQA